MSFVRCLSIAALIAVAPLAMAAEGGPDPSKIAGRFVNQQHAGQSITLRSDRSVVFTYNGETEKGKYSINGAEVSFRTPDFGGAFQVVSNDELLLKREVGDEHWLRVQEPAPPKPAPKPVARARSKAPLRPTAAKTHKPARKPVRPQPNSTHRP